MEEASTQAVEPSFPTLSAETNDLGMAQVESLCMNCNENGMTRFLLTKIPHFKEVILSSFSCEHCGEQNCELQSAGRVQDKGSRYKVTIQNKKDLNRQVVVSDTATIGIPELGLEIPPNKGGLTTIEGVIDRAVNGLQQDQPVRKALDEVTANKIDDFIEKLKQLKVSDSPFTLTLDDPTGNSFIENPIAPKKDEAMSLTYYLRTREQDEVLGALTAENSEVIEEPSTNEEKAEIEEKAEVEEKTNENEVMQFRVNCPNCNAPCETNMKMVDIPYFKEVVLMATNCAACGCRDCEVKSGGGIEPKGQKIKLHITDPIDLARDVLKSETSGVEIPELELSMDHGTLGGKFTTVEGLLSDIKSQLSGAVVGDSVADGKKSAMDLFCEKLDEVISGKRLDVHFILDDPAGNSYVQNVYAPDPDPEMEITNYERNFEQNEELGLNDMKTEHYEES